VTRHFLSAAVAVLALGACDEGKPRHTPPDPFAGPLAPPETAIAAPRKGQSEGLPRRPEPANFTFDHIGEAFDPLNRRPARTAAGRATLFDGFAFDPVRKIPAHGIDVVVDGKAYGAAYGRARPDTAAYFKAPVLTDVGFTLTLPAGSLAAGAHTASIRVIASDGAAYYQGPQIAFEVR
jgi:hypothetical protein